MKERSVLVVLLMVGMMLLLSVLGFAKVHYRGNVEHGDSNSIGKFFSLRTGHLRRGLANSSTIQVE
jgi:hypothetical protein